MTVNDYRIGKIIVWLLIVIVPIIAGAIENRKK
jgi:hypothetical protein